MPSTIKKIICSRTGEAVMQMLNIRFTEPLTGRGRALHSAAGACPINITAPRSSRQPPSSSKRSQDSSLPHNAQQHAHIHDMTENWNVGRAPFGDYPAQSQEAIRKGYGRSNKAAPPPPPPPPPLQQEFVPPIVDTVVKVLAYEAGKGYLNFQGNNGELFSEWMARNLSELSAEYRAAGAPDKAQRCAALVERVQRYSGLPERSERRAAQVQAMAGEVSALKAPALEAAVSPSRVGSYSAVLETSSTGDFDALAAEAHAEETSIASVPVDADSSGEGPGVAALGEDEVPEHLASGAVAEDDYVSVGKRKVKASTVAFRQSFAAAAAQRQAELADDSAFIDALSGGEQRTQQWLDLRQRRLTASAFSKALGFFAGDRESLWEEKLGLRAPFAGNEATAWGTHMEHKALSSYATLTGRSINSCMFKVKHDDPPHGWIGASPDGLIGGLGVSPSSPEAAEPPGILEIKCPFNKGRPEEAVPPSRAIWYYMPQLQGLMDIFNREWCSLYVWTAANGSVEFHVPRNREYWAAAFEVLAEFWWVHVVPARLAQDAGATAEELEVYRPSESHPRTDKLRAWSKDLAMEAKGTRYPPGSDPMQRFKR